MLASSLAIWGRIGPFCDWQVVQGLLERPGGCTPPRKKILQCSAMLAWTCIGEFSECQPCVHTQTHTHMHACTQEP